MAQYRGNKTVTRRRTVAPGGLPSRGLGSPHGLRMVGGATDRDPGFATSADGRIIRRGEPRPSDSQRQRRGDTWSFLTSDDAGEFLDPQAFLKFIEDPEMRARHPMGLAGGFATSGQRYGMARSYADWYRSEYLPQAKTNKASLGEMYDFEFDPWTPDWEIGGSPYQAGLLEEADVVSPDMQAWVASNDELIASTDRLWEVFSSPSEPAPAPVAAPVEDSGTDLEALMMAMAFGGGGNQPPSNPFSGFGTIYPGGGY